MHQCDELRKLRESIYTWKYDYKVTQDLTDSTNTLKECQRYVGMRQNIQSKLIIFASAYIVSYPLWSWSFQEIGFLPYFTVQGLSLQVRSLMCCALLYSISNHESDQYIFIGE